MSRRASFVCRLCLATVFAACLAAGGPAFGGETITYPGNGVLREPPVSPLIPNSLFPDALSGNTVTANAGGANIDWVFGGVTDGAGEVTNNQVVFNGGNALKVNGGWSESGNVSGNSVSIAGGMVREVTGGFSFFGRVYANRVFISGGTVVGWVSGGDGDSRTVDSNSNSVSISGGTIRGGIFGGTSQGRAIHNTVAITGGTIRGAIYGGNAQQDAIHNTVAISGGTIQGIIYGGSCDLFSATHNIVTISGAPDLENADLWGGQNTSSFPFANDAFTGNTLNLRGFVGTVQSLQNFQYLNFVVPGDLPAGSPMLTTTTSPVALGDPRDPMNSPSIVGISYLGGGPLPTVGEKIALVKSNYGGLPAASRGKGMGKSAFRFLPNMTWPLKTPCLSPPSNR